MPYYKSKNVLFIHIPKTGGSGIELAISDSFNKAKGTTSLYTFDWETKNKKGEYPYNILDYPYNTISLQHQYYSTLYKYRDKLGINFNNIKIFSIVRNPYDRIISDLFYLKKIDIDFTAEQVYKVIRYNYLNIPNLDNHNVPQYKFITDDNCQLISNIKIFKCEQLNYSNDEINKFLGFNINIKKGINKNYSRFLNKDSILLINKFYRKDFELFDYKLR
tara:strand:- start:1101 stop:1757 length:657 start_codon:yes stop_codon:yes gene_type:complete